MALTKPKLQNRVLPLDREIYSKFKNNGDLLSYFFVYGPDKFSKVSKCFWKYFLKNLYPRYTSVTYKRQQQQHIYIIEIHIQTCLPIITVVTSLLFHFETICLYFCKQQ